MARCWQDMVQPEDLGSHGGAAAPLPMTDAGHIKGALKYSQIGKEAALTLLKAMTDSKNE